MFVRDRIRELRRVKASQLRPNPKNWRTHPPQQRDAVRGMLAEIGYADALLARELPDGSLELIDGHLRAETTPDTEVPVLVLDLDAAEADKLLALLDPLAGLAETDFAALGTLAEQIDTDSAALQQLLNDLTAEPDVDLADDVADDAPAAAIPTLFQIVVECADEADQQALFERLQREGYACRVVSL